MSATSFLPPPAYQRIVDLRLVPPDVQADFVKKFLDTCRYVQAINNGARDVSLPRPLTSFGYLPGICAERWKNVVRVGGKNGHHFPEDEFDVIAQRAAYFGGLTPASFRDRSPRDGGPKIIIADYGCGDFSAVDGKPWVIAQHMVPPGFEKNVLYIPIDYNSEYTAAAANHFESYGYRTKRLNKGFLDVTADDLEVNEGDFFFGLMAGMTAGQFPTKATLAKLAKSSNIKLNIDDHGTLEDLMEHIGRVSNWNGLFAFSANPHTDPKPSIASYNSAPFLEFKEGFIDALEFLFLNGAGKDYPDQKRQIIIRNASNNAIMSVASDTDTAPPHMSLHEAIKYEHHYESGVGNVHTFVAKHTVIFQVNGEGIRLEHGSSLPQGFSQVLEFRDAATVCHSRIVVGAGNGSEPIVGVPGWVPIQSVSLAQSSVAFNMLAGSNARNELIERAADGVRPRQLSAIQAEVKKRRDQSGGGEDIPDPALRRAVAAARATSGGTVKRGVPDGGRIEDISFDDRDDCRRLSGKPWAQALHL